MCDRDNSSDFLFRIRQQIGAEGMCAFGHFKDERRCFLASSLPFVPVLVIQNRRFSSCRLIGCATGIIVLISCFVFVSRSEQREGWLFAIAWLRVRCFLASSLPFVPVLVIQNRRFSSSWLIGCATGIIVLISCLEYVSKSEQRECALLAISRMRDDVSWLHHFPSYLFLSFKIDDFRRAGSLDVRQG